MTIKKIKIGDNLLHSVYNNLNLNEEGKKYLKIGEKIIKQNKVGLLILAGGQGSRLGFNGPKGLYPIPGLGTLFDMFIRKVDIIEKSYNIKLEKYILTSEFTHEDTKKRFESTGFVLIKQENVQCTDLNHKDVACFSPNGNGGVFKALKNVKLGCEILNIVGIDNVLCNIMDPIAVGCFDYHNHEILSKSVTKNRKEKAGIFTSIDGKILIEEYDTMNDLVEEDEIGTQANIINHFFSKEFLEKDLSLEYHLSKKRLSLESKEVIEGYKKELFIFDSFKFADRSGVINVPRELEFSPLKNGLDKNEFNAYTCVVDFQNATEIRNEVYNQEEEL